MKQKLTSDKEQIIYDVGYTDGSQDQFIPMILIGFCGLVSGFVIGICV